MAITLSPGRTEAGIASIKQYAAEHLAQTLGDLQAGLLLDFVLVEIGPSIYNRAIQDAQATCRIGSAISRASASRRSSATGLDAMHRTALALCVMVVVGAWPLAARAPARDDRQVHANLNQLMRGALYPAANVVFSAQTDNPGDVKPIPGHDPSMATDPLTSKFGGWLAVENAALTLAESANLLSIPGRTCANNVPVPVTDPAWAAFVQDLRDVSMKAYQPRKRRTDKMIEISEPLSAACANCHRRWRDRKTPENRCK